MWNTWPPVRDVILRACSDAVEVYTTSNMRKGWRDKAVLFITCSTFSFLLSFLLLLYLLYTLDYKLAVAGSIAGSCWVLVTAALCLSRLVRCLWLLFLMSCGMKQGRNLLITAGTSLVVLRNFRNTLDNLAGLVRSLVCSLQAKRLFLNISPLDNYIKMLKWVGSIIKTGFSYFSSNLLELEFNLDVTGSVESDKLREKLFQTERALNETAESARAVMDTVFSVGQRLFPAFSFIILAGFTALHLQKYRKNTKYENTFITSRFVQFDEQQKAEGKSQVLPLTTEEERRYIQISSPHLTAQERKAMLKFCIPVVIHVLAWVLVIGIDTLMYYFVKVIKTHLETLEPLHVPLIMNIKEETSFIGFPISEDSRSRDFSYSLALFEKECLPEPQMLLSSSLAPLALVLAALVLMGMAATRLVRMRLLVCERFFADRAEERAKHLHAKILRRRSKWREAETGPGILKSLIRKPHFWCPLLFRLQEDEDSILPESRANK
ncbi:dendritic cell-specific transmembrane protein isoform X2 [Hypomesus transpacificus]|uniref:dendritic cell-specific transmembrane protein isoform X2 n=1 Tax=Hypomesus transpacificus TaxID=137520 RepID=UPI001F0851A1|nr:dendritic cell-specific transmembrane protein isoform X2 [Hypomesus transpacificus]